MNITTLPTIKSLQAHIKWQDMVIRSMRDDILTMTARLILEDNMAPATRAIVDKWTPLTMAAMTNSIKNKEPS